MVNLPAAEGLDGSVIGPQDAVAAHHAFKHVHLCANTDDLSLRKEASSRQKLRPLQNKQI